MAGKRPAKKAAVKREDILGDFPLPTGHYFHPPVVAPAAHSGAYSIAEQNALTMVQRTVGAPETGVYDDATAAAVRAWREQRGLDSSLVIDAEAWETLRKG